MAIKKESIGTITILGLSTIGIRRNNIVSLYYSSVFINEIFHSQNNSSVNVIESRLPYSKLGNVLIIRVISLDIIDEKGREIIKERLESGEGFLTNKQYCDTNGNNNSFIEDMVVDTNFFESGYIDNLAKFVQINKLKVIFVFYNTPLSIIKLKFFCEGYSISGGNNTLKHVLAPYQTTIYNYLSLLYGDIADVIIDNSFRNFTKNKALTRSIFNS